MSLNGGVVPVITTQPSPNVLHNAFAPASGGGGSGSGGGLTSDQQNALAYVNELLAQYGLGSLGAWAYQQVVNGADSNQVIQSLRQTPEYAQRFQAIIQRAAKGLPPISEGDVVNYENQATQTLRAAGFPPGFYDNPQDFTDLISNDVSLNEFTQRISTEWAKVNSAPQEVRDAFADYFGPRGDAALAMTFLDPERSLQSLQQMTEAAQFGGIGRTFGFNLDAGTANRAAQQGLSPGGEQATFAKAAQERPYDASTILEGQTAPDLSEAQLVNAEFGLNAQDQAALAKRQSDRAAQFGGATPQRINQTGNLELATAKQGTR